MKEKVYSIESLQKGETKNFNELVTESQYKRVQQVIKLLRGENMKN